MVVYNLCGSRKPSKRTQGIFSKLKKEERTVNFRIHGFSMSKNRPLTDIEVPPVLPFGISPCRSLHHGASGHTWQCSPLAAALSAKHLPCYFMDLYRERKFGGQRRVKSRVSADSHSLASYFMSDPTIPSQNSCTILQAVH